MVSKTFFEYCTRTAIHRNIKLINILNKVKACIPMVCYYFVYLLFLIVVRSASNIVMHTINIVTELYNMHQLTALAIKYIVSVIHQQCTSHVFLVTNRIILCIYYTPKQATSFFNLKYVFICFRYKILRLTIQ